MQSVNAMRPDPFNASRSSRNVFPDDRQPSYFRALIPPESFSEVKSPRAKNGSFGKGISDVVGSAQGVLKGAGSDFRRKASDFNNWLSNQAYDEKIPGIYPGGTGSKLSNRLEEVSQNIRATRSAPEEVDPAQATRDRIQRMDDARSRVQSNPAMRRLMDPNVNTLPTDSEQAAMIADRQNQARELGQDPNKLPKYLTISRGGKPFPDASGRMPTAEDLGFQSSSPEANRARAEAKYGKLPLSELAKKVREEREGKSYPYVDEKGNTVETPEVAAAQKQAKDALARGERIPGARKRSDWQDLARARGILPTKQIGRAHV